MGRHVADPLEAGREAARTAAWQEAFEHLSNALAGDSEDGRGWFRTSDLSPVKRSACRRAIGRKPLYSGQA
jgi:hypothetical protein